MKHSSDRLQSYILGPMPVTAFLDNYAANRTNKGLAAESNVFRQVMDVDKYPEYLKAHGKTHLNNFIDTLAVAYPDLKMTYSSAHDLNDAIELSMDGGAYAHIALEAEDVRMPIKVSVEEGTDFLRSEEDTRSAAGQDIFALTSATKADIVLALGQMDACLAKITTSQHRLHVYMLYLGRDGARIIRSERAAFLVTDLISYETEGHLLLEWLLAFDEMTLKQQGFDPTVRRLSDTPDHREATIAKLTREKLAPFFPGADSQLPDHPVHKVTIYSDVDGEDEREVLIWRPFVELVSTVERGSQIYPCYEEKTDKVYLLKDSWRDIDRGRECEIIRELNEMGVPHVPTLVCAGDIPGQITTVQGLAKEKWIIPYGDEEPIRAQHHTRQLYREVGRHVTALQSSKEFMYVIYHAFLGHQYAFEHGILHRGVSLSSIFIVDWKLLRAVNNEPEPEPLPEWRKNEVKLDGALEHIGGILIDWDLSLRKKGSKDWDLSSQQHKPSGTWQFMSARFSMPIPTLPQFVEDDIESFLYVVLYTGLRYLEHPWNTPEKAEKFLSQMVEIFEHGGSYKMRMLTLDLAHIMDEGENVIFRFQSHGINRWLVGVMKLYRSWYVTRAKRFAQMHLDDRPAERDNFTGKLGLDELNLDELEAMEKSVPIHDHTRVREMLEIVLGLPSYWPDTEVISDNLSTARHYLSTDSDSDSDSESESEVSDSDSDQTVTGRLKHHSSWVGEEDPVPKKRRTTF